MSIRAVEWLQGELLAYTIGVHVESVGAGASIDGIVEDSVERASGACSLEGELVGGAGKGASATGVERVALCADTLTVGDDLVG